MRNTFLLCLAVSAGTVLADGPADNIPEKVRPVPPPGAKLSDETRAELATGAEKLGFEIEKLRHELKSKPAALALLPDIEIFQIGRAHV